MPRTSTEARRCKGTASGPTPAHAPVPCDRVRACQVVVRVRPPLPRELRGTALQGYQCTTLVEGQGRIITLSENLAAVSAGCASGSARAVRVVTPLQG